MPQARDEAGNIWEVDAQGNPVRLISQAGIPADPAYQYEGPKAAADAQNASNQASASELARPLAEAELRGRELDLREREVELAEAAEQRVQDGQMQDTKTLRQRLRTGNILESVRNVRALAQQGGTGFASLAAPIPMTAARELEAALAPIRASLAFERLQEMRDESKTGGALGQVSERELDLLMGAVASLDTGVSREAFLDSLAKVERHFVGSQLALSGVNPESKEGRQVYREYNVVPLSSGRDDDQGNYQLGIADRYATDMDRQFAQVAQAAFDRGASAEELNALNRKYGYPDYDPQNLATSLAARDAGQDVPIRAPESGYNDPSILDRARQSVAESPIGSYFGGAANALTFGGLDELQGLAAGDSLSEAWSGTGLGTSEANLRKNLQADANPTASLLGNISGGVMGAYGTGALAGVGRGAVSTFAPRALAGDAAFGGLYGAGESNDSRLAGAALGATAGAAGGALGRGVMRQVGNAVGGVGGDAQRLSQAGVRLTPGQIGESSGGTLGRAIKRREDRLAGFSGIGDVIGRRQQEGTRQFNRAAFREGLEGADAVPSEIAEEGIDEASDLVSQAYGRALDGRTLQADQQFTQALGRTLNQARSLPSIGDEAAYAVRESVAPFVGQGGDISGRNLQNIIQELTRRGSKLESSQSSVGPDAANLLRGVTGDLSEMTNRQAPDIMPQFNEANRAYRNLQILKDAVGRGMNTEGVFTPAQLGMAARTNAKKFGGRQASTERPFFDLQRAGQNILPSKVPDSGTAGRQAAGDGIMGTLASISRNARAPIYSEPVLDMINAAALYRAPGVREAGEQIRRRARAGGLFGAPATAYATVGPGY